MVHMSVIGRELVTSCLQVAKACSVQRERATLYEKCLLLLLLEVCLLPSVVVIGVTA